MTLSRSLTAARTHSAIHPSLDSWPTGSLALPQYVPKAGMCHLRPQKCRAFAARPCLPMLYVAPISGMARPSANFKAYFHPQLQCLDAQRYPLPRRGPSN